MGSYRYRRHYRRSKYLIEALFTLNSPPVVSFNLGIRASEEKLLLSEAADLVQKI